MLGKNGNIVTNSYIGNTIKESIGVSILKIHKKYIYFYESIKICCIYMKTKFQFFMSVVTCSVNCNLNQFVTASSVSVLTSATFNLFLARLLLYSLSLLKCSFNHLQHIISIFYLDTFNHKQHTTIRAKPSIKIKSQRDENKKIRKEKLVKR